MKKNAKRLLAVIILTLIVVSAMSVYADSYDERIELTADMYSINSDVLEAGDGKYKVVLASTSPYSSYTARHIIYGKPTTTSSVVAWSKYLARGYSFTSPTYTPRGYYRYFSIINPHNSPTGKGARGTLEFKTQ